MFTGIITDIGIIKQISKRDNGLRFEVATAYDVAPMDMGCSIAHNGVCLTVVKKFADSYAVDVSDETLACTTLSNWKKDTKVNLERALKLGNELGGHMVSGHVDGVGFVRNIEQIGDNKKLTFNAPEDLVQFIAAKGSITIDGVSLTVNGVEESSFWVNLISHTLHETTLGDLSCESSVNLEIDMLARYVNRIVG